MRKHICIFSQRAKVGNGKLLVSFAAAAAAISSANPDTLNKTIYVVLRVDRKVFELCQDLFSVCISFCFRFQQLLFCFWRLLLHLFLLLPLRLLVRAVYLHNVVLSRNLRFVFGAHKSVAAAAKATATAAAAAGCKFRSQVANKRLGHKSRAAI